MKTTVDVSAALDKVTRAREQGMITAEAQANIHTWLTAPRYATYAGGILAHIEEEKWQILDDVFWTIIPFGTGGRRGRMYPFGSNAINERTIGESAQGLANYVKQQTQAPYSCGIAFDTRHQSSEFARLCAVIMVAAGFRVYFLDEVRSTPELSFLVRHKKCSCGIMVTASHNPPSDNAVKVYWSTGGQLLPPHDKGVIDCVMSVDQIRVVDFDAAVSNGKIEFCKNEVDSAFLDSIKALGFRGPRDLKVIYSPLHGVGGTAVIPALKADGFVDVELFAPHATLDGDFPNVPNNISNPENPAVFDVIIERAREVKADLVLATDPDCDRLGCAAPYTDNPTTTWGTITGNQIGALLGDYVFAQRQKAGSLTAEHYLITTLVTSQLARRIADSYGITTYGNNLVGFKWIGGVMDDVGPDKFVLGMEESHGYLVGQHARDKDGAVAAMLMAELAANCKANGQTIHEKLDALYWIHGYHAERLVTQRMAGSEGMAMMQKLMAKFRSDPPRELAGINVAAIRDYRSKTTTRPCAPSEPLTGPTGDLVMIDLVEEGNYVAARPSGTEPKVKFYMFTYVAASKMNDLAETKKAMNRRLDKMQADLELFALDVN